MHEVAAMRGAVSAILEYMEGAGACRVTEVQLMLGMSGHLTEDAARQHFAAIAAGTPAEGASVTISWLPATYQCFNCLHRFQSRAPQETVICPKCGEVALEIERQSVCYVSAIDVAFEEEDLPTVPIPRD